MPLETRHAQECGQTWNKCDVMVQRLRSCVHDESSLAMLNLIAVDDAELPSTRFIECAIARLASVREASDRENAKARVQKALQDMASIRELCCGS